MKCVGVDAMEPCGLNYITDARGTTVANVASGSTIWQNFKLYNINA